MTSRRPEPRLLGIAIVTAVAGVLTACGTSVPNDPGPPEGWIRIEDGPEGVSIDVPAHWRSLEPGDPGWRVVYGNQVTRSEELVEDGSLAVFALPLAPREEDETVVLAIYATHLTRPTTLAKLADAYVQEALPAFGDYHVVARGPCVLPAGACEEIVAERGRDSRFPVRLHFWYFLDGDRSFLVNFNSLVENAERYDPTFVRSAETFRILPAESP